MGKKGGPARWKGVSKKARSEHATKAAKVRWDCYRSQKTAEGQLGKQKMAESQ